MRCARCGHITSAGAGSAGGGPSSPSAAGAGAGAAGGGSASTDQQQRDMAQLVCSSPQCRVVLMYPRGAERVQCSICGTTNCAIAVRKEKVSPPFFFFFFFFFKVIFFAHLPLFPFSSLLSLFPTRFPGEPGRPPRLRRVPHHAHVRARGAERKVRRLQQRDADGEALSSAAAATAAAAAAAAASGAVFRPSVRAAAAAVFAAAGADSGGGAPGGRRRCDRRR